MSGRARRWIRSRWTRAAVALGVIVLAVAFAIARMYPSETVAPDSGFDNARAMDTLKEIARLPHPVNTPEHSRVREYVLQRFRELGYDARIQEGRIPGENWTVRNVIARLRGTMSPNLPGAIMLSAHYDSVPSGPGASDDGAAVAALLEVARILAQHPPRRDVLFLITDGEEAGLYGARVFANDERGPRDMVFDLNFEARGTSGPSAMFQTSRNNSYLIRQYARSVPHPFTTSMAGEVYRRMPNNTDFTIFSDRASRRGLPGLNFAYVDGFENYHTANDDLAHVSVASMRHHGVQALAMVDRLANIDDLVVQLKAYRGDAVYFDVWSYFVVRYPAWAAIPLMILTAIPVVAVVILMIMRQHAQPFGVAASVGIAVVGMVVCAAAVSGCVDIMEMAGTSLKQAHAHFGWFYLAALLIHACCAVSSYFLLRRVINRTALGCGVLLLWLLVLIYTSIATPGASYVFLFPLILATGALFIARGGWRLRGSLRFVLVVALCALAAALNAGPMYMAGLGLTLGGLYISTLLPALLIWLITPPLMLVIIPRFRRAAGRGPRLHRHFAHRQGP